MTSGTPATDVWLVEQQAGFEALTGLTVSAWGGVEMALRDDSPDGPLFTDPDVRFLQLSWLRLIADAGERTVGVYQDTADRRLRGEPAAAPPSPPTSSGSACSGSSAVTAGGSAGKTATGNCCRSARPSTRSARASRALRAPSPLVRSSTPCSATSATSATSANVKAPRSCSPRPATPARRSPIGSATPTPRP